MAYSIEDYLSDIPLQQGKNVEMALSAEQITDGEEEKQAHLQLSKYDISVLIIVEGKRYPIPLASVMKANRRGIAYGTKEEELLEVSKRVQELGVSRGAILSGFFEMPLLGLEQAMSSNSILYVFDGFIQYAKAVGERIRLENGGEMKFGGRERGFSDVKRLHDVVKSTQFQGYKDRVLEDRDLFYRDIERLSRNYC